MITVNCKFFGLKSCKFYCGYIDGFLKIQNEKKNENLQKFEKRFFGCFKALLGVKFTVRLQQMEHPNNFKIKYT